MARRNDHPRVWARLAVALGAALVLGLAAVAIHAAQGTALTGQGPEQHIWALLALGIFAAALAVAGNARRVMDRVPGATPTQQRVASLIVPGATVLALATVVGLAVLGTRGVSIPPPQQPQGIAAPGNAAPSGMPTTGPSGGVDQPPPTGYRTPSLNLQPLLYGFLILLGVALLALLVVVLVRWLMARRAVGRADDGAVDGGLVGDGTGEALADAVQAGQEALAEDPDPRSAIIACYAAMEESLERGGVSRHKADTPTDLLRRAAAAELVQGIAAQTLTDLFTEARYSTHAMGEHQRDQARAALDSIAAHLAAAMAEADARFGAREEIEI